MYQKFWPFLNEKLGWKIGQKLLFSRFWAFTKIFRKSIFSSAKDAPSCAKMFSKCFFFTENRSSKLKYCSSQKSSFSSSSNVFNVSFTFLDSGIVNLNRKCITCHGFAAKINQKNTIYTPRSLMDNYKLCIVVNVSIVMKITFANDLSSTIHLLRLLILWNSYVSTYD